MSSSRAVQTGAELNRVCGVGYRGVVYLPLPPTGVLHRISRDRPYNEWYPERSVPRSEAIDVRLTSMASPHVAGIVALMVQKNPSLTAAEAEATLESTALPLRQEVAPLPMSTAPRLPELGLGRDGSRLV
jgi:subtilisin family serine protease